MIESQVVTMRNGGRRRRIAFTLMIDVRKRKDCVKKASAEFQLDLLGFLGLPIAPSMPTDERRTKVQILALLRRTLIKFDRVWNTRFLF